VNTKSSLKVQENHHITSATGGSFWMKLSHYKWVKKMTDDKAIKLQGTQQNLTGVPLPPEPVRLELVVRPQCGVKFDPKKRKKGEKIQFLPTKLKECEWRQYERYFEAIHLLAAEATSTKPVRVPIGTGLEMTSNEIHPAAIIQVSLSTEQRQQEFATRLTRLVYLFVSGKCWDKTEIALDAKLAATSAMARSIVKTNNLPAAFEISIEGKLIATIDATLQGSAPIREDAESFTMETQFDGFTRSDREIHVIAKTGLQYDIEFDEQKHWVQIQELCQGEWQKIEITGKKTPGTGKAVTYTLETIKVLDLHLQT
jgi:hypothetical protein